MSRTRLTGVGFVSIKVPPKLPLLYLSHLLIFCASSRIHKRLCPWVDWLLGNAISEARKFGLDIWTINFSFFALTLSPMPSPHLRHLRVSFLSQLSPFLFPLPSFHGSRPAITYKPANATHVRHLICRVLNCKWIHIKRNVFGKSSEMEPFWALDTRLVKAKKLGSLCIAVIESCYTIFR